MRGMQMSCRWGAIRGWNRTCGVQGRFIEAIDPNQGIEGSQAANSREERDLGSVKREGEVTNEL